MYKFNDEKMFHDVADGIAVVINFTTGVYYGFNLFGTAVLNCILDGAGFSDIVKAAKQNKGYPEDIEHIVEKFIDSLIEKEIISKTEDDSKAVSICEDSVKDGFVPKFEEYSEVQDLILADPIHEVDPNQGWPVLK